MKAIIARRAALVALIGISIPVVRTVYAGVLGGFATEWTQLANNLQLVSSYIRLGEQLQQQIKMVLDMTKNTEQQVQQTMKLRQLMLADLQSKQAFQAAQMQRQAATEAASEQFFTFGGRTGDGRGYQAGQ
jgi:conjugal transfer/entry exclusion protein